MKRLDDIVDKYYEMVLEYEKCLEDIGGDIFRYRDNKEQMPWRLVEPDIKAVMKKDFSNRNKILSYLKADDIIGDEVFVFLAKDLTDYYVKNGYDVNDEKISEQIDDELETIFEKTKLDPKKYSKNTIKFFDISKRFSKACDDLYKIYSGEYTFEDENKSNDFSKIDIEINNGGTLRVSQTESDKLRVGVAVESIDSKGEVYRRDLISEGDFVMLMNYYRYVVDNDIRNDFINPSGLNEEKNIDVDTEYGLE